MRRPPAKAKRDLNEADIIAELRAHGLSVYPLDKPLDLLCGYGGKTYLVEVKSPKGKFTPPQLEFMDTWRGGYTVLRSIEEASLFARNVRNQ
jgi:hypothetical protein